MATIVRPCPFCGSRDLDTSGWAVQCNQCGATGPLSKGAYALELWERRPQQIDQFILQNPHLAISEFDF